MVPGNRSMCVVGGVAWPARGWEGSSENDRLSCQSSRANAARGTNTGITLDTGGKHVNSRNSPNQPNQGGAAHSDVHGGRKKRCGGSTPLSTALSQAQAAFLHMGGHAATLEGMETWRARSKGPLGRSSTGWSAAKGLPTCGRDNL